VGVLDRQLVMSAFTSSPLTSARIAPACWARTSRPSSAPFLFWLSRLTEHSSHAGGVLGLMMVTAAGIGLMFVPMSLVALTKVADAGVASSLLNTGQQVGGSIGLAVLGTVAWSAVASSLRSGAAQGHALAYGFSRGFVVSAAITLLTLVIALVMLRVRREDLGGINSMAVPSD
jgi:hypothetical protein